MSRRTRAMVWAFSRLNAVLMRRGYGLISSRTSGDQLGDGMAMLLGLSQFRPIVVVVVGAGSDAGASQDPGVDFAHRFPERVATVILIEPIPERAELTRERIAASTDVRSIEYAVGDPATSPLSLWETDAWAVELLARSRRGGGASGGRSWTSASREHVARHLASSLRLVREEALEHVVPRVVPIRPLSEVLDEQQLPHLDYLQVDTEGFDDDVLYSADLGRLAPKVIRFERIHLDDQRLRRLDDHLTGFGYVHIHDSGFDRVYALEPTVTA